MSYFTNIAVQNVNKGFVYITDLTWSCPSRYTTNNSGTAICMQKVNLLICTQNSTSISEPGAGACKACALTTLETINASVNSNIAHIRANPRAFVISFLFHIRATTGHWYLQSCHGGGELFTGPAFVSI